MLNFQVVIFKFQIKIYHKRPSPAPPAAKKGWRWMAFSDGSQYHDWIRQEKKMLFPKKTLVYLVQYSIRTSNLWRLPHVRQTTKKKTSPPPPTPKIRNVGGKFPRFHNGELEFHHGSPSRLIPQSNYSKTPRWFRCSCVPQRFWSFHHPLGVGILRISHVGSWKNPFG